MIIAAQDLIFSYYNSYRRKYEKNLVFFIKQVEERKYINFIRYLVIFELNDIIEKNKYQLIALKFGVLTKHPFINYLRQQTNKFKHGKKAAVLNMWIQKNILHIHNLIYQRTLYISPYTSYNTFLEKVFDLDYDLIVSKTKNL